MPDPITWYALGKEIEDTETILEAVDAKILAHNLDPSAHGQSGEVVFEHRTATLLDHLFGSVSFRHLVDDHYLAYSGFSELGGWSIGGTVVEGLFGCLLTTPALTGEHAVISSSGVGGSPSIQFDKDPFFQLSAKINQTSNQTIYLITGGVAGDFEGDCIGYKIVNNTLYAVWSKAETEYTSSIAGITLTNLNVYRAYCDNTDQKVYFYINGILQYTATTNYPTNNATNYGKFDLRTDANVAKSMLLVDWLFETGR